MLWLTVIVALICARWIERGCASYFKRDSFKRDSKSLRAAIDNSGAYPTGRYAGPYGVRKKPPNNSN